MADPGFIAYSQGLNPRFKVPCRSTIHRRIDDLFVMARRLVAAKANKAEGISVTIDGVTVSQTSKKYLVGTIHFVDEDGEQNTVSIGVKRLLEKNTGLCIKECVLQMLNNMGIRIELVKYITTDGATNMVDAGNQLGWPRIWCVCHVIHLTVNDAIDKCQFVGKGTNPPKRLRILIDTIKAIVTYVKQSSVQAILHTRTNGKGLLQSVSTRWNSDYDMLDRFVELYSVLNEILLDIPTSPTLPTMDEIRELKEVIVILKPFKVKYL